MKRLSLVLFVIISTVLIAPACNKQPPDLTQEAKVAFYATRVVKVLDVVRDAAIAANELSPPAISTEDTRTIVLWHKTSIQVIQATPGGWKPTVLASIYALTCHPAAAPVPPVAECTPQLPQTAVTRIYPYIGLALVVMSEVQ